MRNTWNKTNKVNEEQKSTVTKSRRHRKSQSPVTTDPQSTFIDDLRQRNTSVINVVDPHTVTITNTKVNTSGAGDSRERVRSYHVDYAFDSSKELSDLEYASQDKIFNIVGRDVLSSLTNGVSACVFTYGHSATGKTYTMMGTVSQPGLVPRLCNALAENVDGEVTLSFLEIYNERVHDLLAGDVAPPACHSLPRRRGNTRKDLRVREHPTKGPYVQNLRRVAVHDAGALLSLVEEGNNRRRTAATRRNSASSRSHALLEITTPHATLHLADLAGSEKASWECSGGGRQKEGANINKSLVALSNVVSALVSGNSGRRKFVPYRDSALTWLLKDCFTGGAKTYIIATVSPSAACYNETNSTLRWVARAKQLPSNRLSSAINNNNTRSALQAQLNQLIAELTLHHIKYIPETGQITYEDKHWLLNKSLNKNINQSFNKSEEDTKIGSIMNLPQKTSNSESIASSTASGSSEAIEKISISTDITNEINKEVDKLFGPVLTRSGSGVNLKKITSNQFERRMYRSQEVLPIEKTLSENRILETSSLTQSNEPMENFENERDKCSPIPISYESQRAEIVASVTERLYSKLNKKDDSIFKYNSAADKKNMEPLSELKICTNARQRLMEISRKALKNNKRRIGIPAQTQTRTTVIRMKDAATDVQPDLDFYLSRVEKPSFVLSRDIGTETTLFTPRCKEISVGPNYGSLHFTDRATSAVQKLKLFKTALSMTDELIVYDRSTQTGVLPNKRKMRTSPFCNYCNGNDNYKFSKQSPGPFIKINISQPYADDSDSQDSDDNKTNPLSDSMATPDLLTNHSNVDINIEDEELQFETEMKFPTSKLENEKKCSSDDFLDTEDRELPRGVGNSGNCNKNVIKNIILGRDENIYPYNINISPYKERDETQRTVKFKDYLNEATLPSLWKSKSKIGKNYNPELKSETTDCSNSETSVGSESTDSSKMTTNSFVWKKGKSYRKKTADKVIHQVDTSILYNKNLAFHNESDKDWNEFYDLPENRANASNNSSSTDSNATNKNHELPTYRKYRTNLNGYILDDRSDDNQKTFDDIERNIMESCNRLEKSVIMYDSYLASNVNLNKPKTPMTTPRKYLQHLVKLRREAVKSDSNTTDNYF